MQQIGESHARKVRESNTSRRTKDKTFLCEKEREGGIPCYMSANEEKKKEGEWRYSNSDAIQHLFFAQEINQSQAVI